MTPPGRLHPAPSAEAGLIRTIGRWDLIAVTINSVIGAGIFGLPSKIFGLVGSYSLAAFLLCAVFTAMIVLCFAEVGSRFTGTGGPYLYSRQAFGPATGFMIGWLMWIARVAAFAANTSIMLGYLGLFWPALATGATRSAAICAITILITAVNLVGVRDVALATNLITIAKLAPLLLLIVTGLSHVHMSSFALGPAPAPAALSSAMLLLVYAYTGFEIAVIPGAEMRDPQRDLPRAILTAIGIVAVIYILIQFVCIGALPDLVASDRPLAEAAGRFLGPAGAAIVAAGAVISIIGNLNVVILAASRLPFAMAERGELPRFFAIVNKRFRTPHVSILITAAVMAALTLSGTFLYAVAISALARLIIYGTTCTALPVLRKRAGAAPFRAPAGTVVAILALTLAAWLLWNTTWREVRDTAIAAAVGLAVYALSRRTASSS